MNENRVAAAMSGGVDSTLAAALLLDEGLEVIGVTLELPEGASGSGAVRRAEEAARALGVRLEVLDAREAFERQVLVPFCEAYRGGRTPNPCVDCNERIKFGLLREFARSLGFGGFATGHYARTVVEGSRIRLLRARDLSKDQTYFLWRLGQEHLRGVRFPVGGLTKSEVRATLRDRGLPLTDLAESMDVCFAPAGGYAAWLESRIPAEERRGTILDTAGQALGTHDGVQRFTIGQRRGLGVASGRPQYVVRIDAGTRSVVVGEEKDLLSGGLLGSNARWVSGDPPLDARVLAKIRHRHEPARARVETRGAEVRVRFEEPQRAVTPGQSVVFFEGEEVLGGAVIDEAVPVS